MLKTVILFDTIYVDGIFNDSLKYRTIPQKMIIYALVCSDSAGASLHEAPPNYNNWPSFFWRPFFSRRRPSLSIFWRPF